MKIINLITFEKILDFGYVEIQFIVEKYDFIHILKLY